MSWSMSCLIELDLIQLPMTDNPNLLCYCIQQLGRMMKLMLDDQILSYNFQSD